MHWAAPAFLDLVESLVELARAPVLVLCLARPDLLDLRPHWGGGRLSSSSVLLDILTETESEALLTSWRPTETSSRGRANASWPADGNPLYIEQLLAAAPRRGGRCHPRLDPHASAARLDRLDGRDRAVLQAAAVCGTSFTTEDVAELVERTRPRLC